MLIDEYFSRVRENPSLRVNLPDWYRRTSTALVLIKGFYEGATTVELPRVRLLPLLPEHVSGQRKSSWRGTWNHVAQPLPSRAAVHLNSDWSGDGKSSSGCSHIYEGLFSSTPLLVVPMVLTSNIPTASVPRPQLYYCVIYLVLTFSIKAFYHPNNVTAKCT